MDPYDPLDARQVVIEYARVLERDITESRHPARIDSLPYAKPVIKTAIATSVKQLARTGQLTDELREYFETAYTGLAEYLDSEIVDLIRLYRESAEELTEPSQSARDRTQTAAWRRIAESSALAGEVARATTKEAGVLRSEFRGLLGSD